MDKTLLGFSLLLIVAGGATAHAQRVYEVAFKAEADLLFFLTDQESEAALVVFQTQYQSDARRDLCDGIWYRTPFSSQADITYMMTSCRSEADVTISYTPYRSQASVTDRACSVLRSVAGSSEARARSNY